MKILKTLGIEYLDKMISEANFKQYNIVSTKEAIEEYFKKYGYSFVAPYDFAQDLIVVQDKNYEISMLLGMTYDSLVILNYKTGEIIGSRLTADGLRNDDAVILSIKYRINSVGDKKRLIKSDSGEVLLEADFITNLSSDKVLFRKYNIEYIIDLNTLEIYPLIKKERSVYQGVNPESFIDFRNGMLYQEQNCLFSVDISQVDVDFIVRTFPYGEKKDKLFCLIKNPIKYGIRYEEEEIREVWYDTEQERDEVYKKIQEQLLGIFEKENEEHFRKNK